MKKEENGYEEVDPMEWAESYTFEEYLKIAGTEIEPDPIFLNNARTLQTEIKDGDYTLREGIDYEVRYFRGHGDAMAGWIAFVTGKGNYDRLFFCAGEYSQPKSIRAMSLPPSFVALMDLFYPMRIIDDPSEQEE